MKTQIQTLVIKWVNILYFVDYKRIRVLPFVLLFGLFPVLANAKDFYAVKNGSWNKSATWSTVCGGKGGAGIPVSTDNAHICMGIDVSISQSNQCKNLVLYGGSINFVSDITLTVNGDLTINNDNLIKGNGSTRILNVSGNVFISPGASIDISGQTFRLTGDLTNNGTINFSGTSGTKTFNNIINNGTWNNPFNEGITINGNFANYNVFNSGSGVYTFAGLAKTISGNAITLNLINITGSVSNLTTISAAQLIGNGTFEQGTGSVLNITGELAVKTLSAGINSNVISYNGTGPQIVNAGNHYNVYFTQSGTKSLSGRLNVAGDLSVEGTAILDVYNFDIHLSGNWSNISTISDPLIQGTGTVFFEGKNAQNIVNTGNPNGTLFNNITVNNTLPSAALTLKSKVTVNGILNLIDGHVITSQKNILGLGLTSVVLIGAVPDSSFIKGPMIQTFNVSSSLITKTFPVGKGDNMHRFDLSIKQTNSVSTFYTGEYFNSSAAGLNLKLPETLQNVSTTGYWDISNGNIENINSGFAKLFYNANDVVTDPVNLRVAESDGAGNWIDLAGEGNSIPTGIISSKLSFLKPGVFTLANSKGGDNPLPIGLSSFEAHPEDGFISFSWTTLSETNNDYFTVEKSKDAVNFEPVAIIEGAGKSNKVLRYSTRDYDPFHYVSYKRLKQTDFNGQYTYSKIVTVNYIMEDITNIVWWQDGSVLNLSIKTPYEGIVTIHIFESSGKLVVVKSFTINTSLTSTTISTENLKPGIYIIKMTYGNQLKAVKIVIQ